MVRTVVELDLVGYSGHLSIYEQGLGVHAAAGLDAQVQTFVDAGLHATQLTRKAALHRTTGDGAILVFETAETAHRFAEGAQQAVCSRNAQLSEPTAKRHFRIGAATGELHETLEKGAPEIAGMTIVRAVRLESAARPGELLVDEETFRTLPAELQGKYGQREEVVGKRDERFVAYRCVMDPDAAMSASTTQFTATTTPVKGDRRRVMSLFDRLPPERLDRVILGLEMPGAIWPSQRLTYEERWVAVMRWAASAGRQALAALEDALTEVLGPR